MAATIKLKLNLTTINQLLDQKAPQKMEEAAINLHKTTVETLSQKGTGRVYTHYFFTDAQGRLRIGKKRWKPHQASAEGKPPARDTSQLVQSIKWRLEGNGRRVVGKVGTDLALGLMLEFGTKKMGARPWLKPSFDKALPTIKDILSRKWF